MNNLKKHIWNTRVRFRFYIKTLFEYTKRKTKLLWRKLFPYKTSRENYTFAILCIKRTKYCDLVIRQANSLHYFNPTHKFIVYTDEICNSYLKKKINYFDYPKQITVKKAFADTRLPWTYYKMEMRIENALAGGIDIDADMFWHEDPVIDRTRPLMFAPAFVFSSHPPQADLILNVFKKPEWLYFTHFVSAFVSIPKKFVTEEFVKDARKYVKNILDNPLDFMTKQSDKDETYRVSEEIATCLALQSHYPGLTQPLKKDGNKKDKNLLEPLYYGCENQIIY